MVRRVAANFQCMCAPPGETPVFKLRFRGRAFHLPDSVQHFQYLTGMAIPAIYAERPSLGREGLSAFAIGGAPKR
jgi:hypothetical protein